jgi:hypothetical protein
MLRQAGYGARVVNAGIYGNTTAEMLARVDRDIPAGTRIVILDMNGGLFNDAFKGIGRAQSDTNMAAIQEKLRARGIMVIPVSGAALGAEYHEADRVHLTAEGHRVLASQLLPQVERVLGPPQAQATPLPPAPSSTPNAEVRDACMADAKRLCAAVLGDDAQRHECMHEHRAELSHDCLVAIARSRQ